MDESFFVTAVWTFRTVAGFAGAFILLEWFLGRERPLEVPSHSREWNNRAWAFMAAGCLVGTTSYLVFDVLRVRPTTDPWAAGSISIVWILFTFGIVMRAALRAEQPRLIWLATAVVTVGSFFIIGMGGRT